MSQSKTSWTKLFHSPVGFLQDVPYSELLSSWLLASEKYLLLTRRMIVKFHQLQRRKKNLSEMFHCHLICHMDWDRNISPTLRFCLCQNSIEGMTIIFEKGWGGGGGWAIFFWARNNFLGLGCAGIFFCSNCPTLPSKNSSPSVSPVSNKLLVWKYDFFNKPPLYEPVSSLYKVYKIKYIPMFLWAKM